MLPLLGAVVGCHCGVLCLGGRVQSGDGWNKNGAGRAAPTWSLREGIKELGG